MSRIILIITFASLLFSEDKIIDDLAYVMVLERINKKTVPTQYIKDVFSNKNKIFMLTRRRCEKSRFSTHLLKFGTIFSFE